MATKSKHRLLLTLAFLLSAFPLSAQQPWCPEPTNQLVNDYSAILSDSERNELEQRLVAFDDSTSNQILIIITPSLHDCEIMELGTRIGTTWGVGQNNLSNGVVILIKSKTDDEPYGDVAILPGYGLEGALPDAFCRRIIDDVMIDPLAAGNYYRALSDALDIIEPVCRGEYSYDSYKRTQRRNALWGLIGFIIVAVIFAVVLDRINRKHGGGHSGGTGTPYIGSIPHGGYWGGGFGSFSGGFGGGFGGFGGGSFGGGGAHGRF